MSHQQNQLNNRNYKDRQDYLYETHVTARIGSIHNSLIRSSSALIYTHKYTPNETQSNEFAIALRTLNTSIFQLIDTNFDLLDFHQCLTPFKEPAPSSPSPSLSTTSEESS